MKALTPLIELATHKSLDLFFRVGQGYVARATHEAGFRQGGHAAGVSPFGIQSQAEARIVSALGPLPHDGRLNAWPVARPLSTPGARRGHLA
jgi:hypothetical protein